MLDRAFWRANTLAVADRHRRAVLVSADKDTATGKAEHRQSTDKADQRHKRKAAARLTPLIFRLPWAGLEPGPFG